MNIEDIIQEKLVNNSVKLRLKKGLKLEYQPKGETGIIFKELEKDETVQVISVYDCGDGYSFALMVEFYINEERYLFMIDETTDLDIIEEKSILITKEEFESFMEDLSINGLPFDDEWSEKSLKLKEFYLNS